MRGEIMALRQDPTANALMAGVFTNSNAKHLTNKLGRAPTDGELYIAHFMGASGAARLITAAENNPGAVAAQCFPAAARANRSIFFDKSGRARNFAEVAQNLVGRYDTARVARRRAERREPPQAHGFVAETARVARAYQVADATSRMPAASTHDRRRSTDVQAAAQVAPGEPVFHNPYRAGERRQPVSTAVADLWTSAQAQRHAPAGAPRAGRPWRRRVAGEAARQPRLQRQQPARCRPRRGALAVTRTAQPRPVPGISEPDVRSLVHARSARHSVCRHALINNSATIAKIYGEPFVKGRALVCLEPAGSSSRQRVEPDMIVRQFLFWLRSAPAGERAEATAALARAYLYSDLSDDDLAAAEGAMTMLLDDPSPLVRAALAEVLAASEYAPASIIYALAADQPEIATLVLERSPLLLDADLVDAVATQGTGRAMRDRAARHVPRSVAAAIAEVGAAEACLELLENPAPTSRRSRSTASCSVSDISRRFVKYCWRAKVLPRATRQALVAKLSETLADFVVARDWLNEDRARRVAKEACEKATVALAAGTPEARCVR